MSAYGDISPRTAAYAAKDLLKRGLPFLILEKFGQGKPLPGNSSTSMKFRRYNALDSTPTTLAEGVTPAARPLTVTDVTATLSQMGSRIQVTDVIIDTHEDPVLQEATVLLGEQAAQMIEKMRVGVIRAGTNVVYANGATRNAVNTTLTLATQRRATKALKRQNGRPITTIIKSTAAFGTEAVAPGFIGLIHTDMESDIRNMAGFVAAEKYGAMTPFENEIGKVDDVRYLSSTIFEPFPDAGGAKGLMTSTTGVNADVYPVLYLAANAYGIVALKGKYAVTPMIVNPKPSDSDPMGQRGHAAWKAMQTAVILNDFWLVRVEACATA